MKKQALNPGAKLAFLLIYLIQFIEDLLHPAVEGLFCIFSLRLQYIYG